MQNRITLQLLNLPKKVRLVMLSICGEIALHNAWQKPSMGLKLQGHLQHRVHAQSCLKLSLGLHASQVMH